MKLEELKKRIDFCANKLKTFCPKIEVRYVGYEKTALDREVYHVQIEYEFKLSEEEKNKLFLKEAQPCIGFDLDLDYYDDKTIQNCIGRVFAQSVDLLRYMENNLPQVVEKLEFK